MPALIPEEIISPTVLRCAHGPESLFVSQRNLIEVNLHAHSHRSDGQLSVQRIAEIAKRWLRNIAITDHNIPPEVPGHWPEGLIPGMEITTWEGVDVLVIDTLERIHQLFDMYVRPHLHRTRPRACATRLPLQELLRVARYRVFPHMANVEGLSQLSAQEQVAALSDVNGLNFLEVNALATKRHNDAARSRAEDANIPLISTGDTHRGEEQYVGSGSDLPACLLLESDEPLVSRLMQSMHVHHAHLDHRQYPLTMGERAATGLQVAHRNGLRATSYFLWKNILRIPGWRPYLGRRGLVRFKPKIA